MGCSQTLNGIIRDCLPNKGGVTEFYAVAYDSVESVTAADGIITAITLASNAKFTTYQLPRGVASMTSTPTIDNGTGVKYFTNELTVQFNRMGAAKKIEVDALISSELAIIFKDGNGCYFYLGYDNPVLASGGAAQTGAAASDGNYYQLVLQDESSSVPYEVDNSIIAGLLA